MNPFTSLVQKQRTYFLTQETKPYAFRMEQLRKLEEYGHENEEKYPWMPSAWNNR